MLRTAFWPLGCVLLLASCTLALAQDTVSPAQPPTAPSSIDTPTSTSDPAGVTSHSDGARDDTQPLRVGKEVKRPKVLSDPDPAYSDVARRAHYQGMVVLWLIVKPDGTPDKVRVQRSIGMGLDEAAIAAVKTWRFQPATRDGQPVPVMINVEVNFRIDGGGPQSSLQPPPEAKGDNPQFPGADLAKYPLVIHIGTITGVPDGKSFQIVASASLKEAAETRPLSISCSGKKNNCAFLSPGNYPARWQSPNHELEITGKQLPGNSWDKAEFVVK